METPQVIQGRARSLKINSQDIVRVSVDQSTNIPKPTLGHRGTDSTVRIAAVVRQGYETMHILSSGLDDMIKRSRIFIPGRNRN